MKSDIEAYCRNPHQGFYLFHPESKELWIVPPKCGSTSFSHYFPETRAYLGIGMGDIPSQTYIVVRHPFERVVSALKWLNLPYTTEAVLENQHNDHLKPYSKWIKGRKGVIPVSLHSLSVLFPDYPTLNKGDHPDWQDTDIDWDAVYPIYAEDFELCRAMWLYAPALS